MSIVMDINTMKNWYHVQFNRALTHHSTWSVPNRLCSMFFFFLMFLPHGFAVVLNSICIFESNRIYKNKI